ncbi:kunitz-type serine protease inhibitor C [Magallana gigas]|uniref:kunitz-type serine protease inhibitor C n=1 Tax=Magallana gigas TaxID=29159 RepID=UPI0033414834
MFLVFDRRNMEKILVIGLMCALSVVVCGSRGYGYYRKPPPPSGGVCSLRPDVGECEGICPRFYYDARRRTCRKFNYGCCGGNANNFKTKALCQRVCGRRKPCPLIFCFVGACTIQTCPNFPKATCVAVCPCESLWIYKGEDVTSRC